MRRKRNKVKRHRVRVNSSSEKSLFVVRFLLLVGIVVAGSLFYVYQHTQLVHTGYQLRKKEKALDRLVKQNHRLEMKISRIKSPNNLERLIVKYGLKLTKPKEEQVVRLPRVKPSSQWSSNIVTPETSVN